MMKQRLLTSNKGSAMIIFTLTITAIMGFGAIVVDIGSVAIEKQKLQSAVDAASLAAAQNLPDTAAAIQTANQYIQSNGYEPSDISIEFSDSGKTITITGNKTVNYTLAKVIGFENTAVNVSAKAMPSGQWAGEALPFINLDDDYQTDPEIVAWEKVSPGDFESINNFEIVNGNDPDKIYFKIDYLNGITLKKGTVATIKQEVGYIFDQHKPAYILSLSRTIMNSGRVMLKDGSYKSLSNLKNGDIVDPSQLVLLKCIFHDYDYSGKTLFLTVQAVYDIANDEFPPDYISPDRGKSRLIN